jgi:putative endonuclease
MMSHKTLGNYGESWAREYLQGHGYRILEENFRNKLGEIDLIAQDGKTICFVEVKTRQSLDQGQPYEAITLWKIRKLSQMATFYLKHKYHSLEIPSRFDVISIVQNKTGTPNIQHIKNAFDSTYSH